MKDAIFFNPRCTNCRVSLELLKEHGLDLPVIEYLDQPPDRKTLEEVCGLLGVRPYDLVRQKEPVFAELKLGEVRPDDDARWYQLLSEHPVLLQRPIVVHNGKAVVGRPPETILKIL
jgi:arsenate reductase